MLPEEKKVEIRLAIQASMTSRDRHPDEIIREDYNGDEDAYLLGMAKWLNIGI